ncbi:hypothetical protein [Paralysiella testudinis]|uniref:Uncharacterized protein n=1 Tax=Paralysiella testudinis TaxID=2809020 RepID=A0A892ZLQ9_9NEIS|nr:hypothetical protein [Paralysiella testudinis]QRQ82727.1 hypothetical protein JQU52_04890 [Paralysiella testudinis]
MGESGDAARRQALIRLRIKHQIRQNIILADFFRSGSPRPLRNFSKLMKNAQICHSGVGRNPLFANKLILNQFIMFKDMDSGLRRNDKLERFFAD